MRTDLTRVIAGSQVRGVVTIGALDEMIGTATWDGFMRALLLGDPRTVRATLRATLRAAGDLRPLDIEAEAARLIEEGGVATCAEFCAVLVQDAIDKAETARKNSPAAAPQGEVTAAPETTGA